MTRAETRAACQDEVVAGLCQPIKSLPCKLLYDAAGADLFERITEVEDYYLTRAEHALLAAELPAIAALVGPHARVVEPGSGAGKKTRMLLGALDRVATYVPIDVSAVQLADNALALRGEFPDLEVLPVLGDYTQAIEMPVSARPHENTVVFFPGSTIGNFEPDAARRFLKRLATLAGPDAMLLLGADANGNRDELLRAYDDSEGVTAAFDLNVLAHVNRTHGATFDLDQFMHRAVWNAARSRIEMHLVSKRAQTVKVGDATFTFARGEPIVTEHCYKHSPEALAQILRDSGWTVTRTFADSAQRMRLWLAASTSPRLRGAENLAEIATGSR